MDFRAKLIFLMNCFSVTTLAHLMQNIGVMKTVFCSGFSLLSIWLSSPWPLSGSLLQVLFKALSPAQSFCPKPGHVSCALTFNWAPLCFATNTTLCRHLSFCYLKRNKTTSPPQSPRFLQQVSSSIPFPWLCFTPITRRVWFPFEAPLLFGSVLTVPHRCVSSADLTSAQLASPL